MRGTGLRPHELATPATYAVEADFVRALPKLRGLCHRFRAELNQWSRKLGLSPTACAILAVTHLIRTITNCGRHGRGDGLGFQAPTRWWVDALGRDPSTVCDAYNELEGDRDSRWARPAKDQGHGKRILNPVFRNDTDRVLAKRFSPTRKVADITGGRLKEIPAKDGCGRHSINVHGVLYATARGQRTLSELGLTRRYVRGMGRRLTRTGLVDFLLKTIGRELRAIAVRCGAQRSNPIPEGNQNPNGMIKTAAPAAPPRSRCGEIVENTGPPVGRAGDVEALRAQLRAERIAPLMDRYKRLQNNRTDPLIWRRLDGTARLELAAELAQLASQIGPDLAPGSSVPCGWTLPKGQVSGRGRPRPF